MGLVLKFVNYNSVLAETLHEHITLHKEYPVYSKVHHHNFGEDKYTVGWIHMDNDNSLLFSHNRKDFDGSVLTSSKDFHDNDPVMKSWGYYIDIMERELRCEKTRSWIADEVHMNIQVCYSTIRDRVAYFNPYPSETSPGKIALTASRDKFEADKQTVMSIGKALKLMFPELEDADLETLVDKFRAKMQPKNYVIKTGTSKEDFNHAYSHSIEDMENPYTTSWRKSLANSCMRYTFEQFSHHPGEAYASGDFTMVWVENEHGQIAARSVLSSNGFYGPIYGTTEQAMDRITEWMEHRGNNAATGSDPWVGLKMLRLVHRDGEYIAPYIDVNNNGLDDMGDYLEFTDGYGEIETSHHQGILYSGGSCYCAYCEDRVHEDEIRYAPDFGDICENCSDEHFFYCEHENELYHWDYAQRVYSNCRWGNDWVYVHEANVEYYCDAIYVECRNEWWIGEDTYYSEDDDQHFTKFELESGEYVEHDGEYYREDSDTLAELLQEDEE